MADAVNRSFEAIPPTRSLTAEQVVRILGAIQEINAEGSLDGQLALIAKCTTELAGCERCSVFLVDPEKRELWSKVAIGLTDQEIRFPVGRGIAGSVAETGTLENILDAYADPRFNPDVDRQTGFRTRNMLVVPVKNRQQEVVGVLQLINKREGGFTGTDEALLTVFGAQVAIAIQNVQRLEELRATDLQLKAAFLASEQKEEQRREARGRTRLVALSLGAVVIIVAGFFGLRAAGVSIPFLAPQATVGEGQVEGLGGAVSGPADEGAPITNTHTVARESLSAKIVQTGYAEPATTRAVVSGVMGTAVEVMVREGQRVVKGQPLLRLEEREARTRLHTANANLLRAQAQLQSLQNWNRGPEITQAKRSVQLASIALEEGRGRYEVTRRLFDRGIASRDELESAERAYERLKLELQSADENVRAVQDRASETEQAIARAQIKNAEAEVEEINRLVTLTMIVAPIDGVVMLPEGAEGRRLRLPEPGDQVQGGIPVMLLGDMGYLRVRLALDEVDVDKVRVGQRAQARVDAFPGYTVEGRVEFVSPVARIVEKVPFFDTIVSLSRVPSELRDRVRLGMSATIEIVTADRTDVIAIPVQAVIRQGGETVVDLVGRSQGEDKPPVRQRTAVKLGVSTAKMVEVLEGLEEGNEIALP
jgi:multidrug resistance efflux pump/putative methionine-R-sulfoxide reductase with GAF domain